MISIMKNKVINFLIHSVLPILFWLAVWDIAATIYNNSYFLPGVAETAAALWKILLSPDFPLTVLLTLLRIFTGITLGTLFGSIVAIISHKIKLLYSLIAPINSIIKATPVASIIILLWISMNGNSVAILVAFLMVFPIIFQNTFDAFNSIDPQLIEVSRVYEFSYQKRLKLLVFPALKQYFIPAFITAIGLAFKAEIAAEIIAGVKNSIGQMIYYAKDVPATDEVFAWTIVGVAFSILVEKTAKQILTPKALGKKEENL